MPPGRVTTIVASVWLAALAAAVPLQIARLLTRRHLLWSHLLFVSALATLAANWLLLDWRDARYVLPVHAPLVFMVGVELLDLADRRRLAVSRRAVAIALMLALQTASMTEFARYTFMWWTNPAGAPSESRTLRKVIGHLQSRGVTHAFAMNALLQWPIIFYSDESVIARWKSRRKRYPNRTSRRWTARSTAANRSRSSVTRDIPTASTDRA